MIDVSLTRLALALIKSERLGLRRSFSPLPNPVSHRGTAGGSPGLDLYARTPGSSGLFDKYIIETSCKTCLLLRTCQCRGSAGEVWGKYRGSTGEVRGKYWGKYWGSIGEVLGKYGGSTGEVLGKYWGSNGEVQGSIGEVLGKYWGSTGEVTGK